MRRFVTSRPGGKSVPQQRRYRQSSASAAVAAETTTTATADADMQNDDRDQRHSDASRETGTFDVTAVVVTDPYGEK